MTDIGNPKREIIVVPIPENEPVQEPSPQPVPVPEQVPA